MRRFLSLLALAVVVTGPLAVAGDGSEPDPVGSYFVTDNPVERLRLARKIAAETNDAKALHDRIARARTWSADAVTGEVVEWKQRSNDGVVHTVFAYAPTSYTPEKAWPLMLWLHGGISRAVDGGGAGGIRMWKDEADAKGFLIVSPSTQNGAHWWTPTGAAYIRDVVLSMAKRYRVDADGILATGFSDGGSGAFHLLAHDPSLYACFMPMMGNPLVTRLFGGPTWSTNLASRPVFAVNGGKDQLYPSERMLPFIDAMKEAGCRMAWVDEPESGHEPSFLQRRWQEMHGWWLEHGRDALPKEILWASSLPAHTGRFAWIEIRALDEKVEGDKDLALPTEMALPAPNPRPRLGIMLDLEAGGPGVRIREVQEGTPAAEAGFRAGDRIVALGDDDLGDDVRASVMKLRAFLESLEDEDGRFGVRRGDEELEIETRPKVLAADLAGPERPAALGFDVAPGVVRARLESGNVVEIHARGVSKVRLHLAESMVDLDEALVVRVNGKEAFRGTVARDAAYLLTQAVEQVAGSPRYAAYLDLEVD